MQIIKTMKTILLNPTATVLPAAQKFRLKKDLLVAA